MRKNWGGVMRKLPIDIGVIHFVGIGGIGMSGIAEILHNLNYQVQGSDISESPTVGRLRNLGLKIFIGQKTKMFRRPPSLSCRQQLNLIIPN